MSIVRTIQDVTVPVNVPTFTCDGCGAKWTPGPEEIKRLVRREIPNTNTFKIESDDEILPPEWNDGTLGRRLIHKCRVCEANGVIGARKEAAKKAAAREELARRMAAVAEAKAKQEAERRAAAEKQAEEEKAEAARARARIDAEVLDTLAEEAEPAEPAEPAEAEPAEAETDEAPAVGPEAGEDTPEPADDEDEDEDGDGEDGDEDVAAESAPAAEVVEPEVMEKREAIEPGV